MTKSATKVKESKLLQLKEWISLAGAAQHLSTALREDVNAAEILRLALDGHLTLSVNFVMPVMARRGRIVPTKKGRNPETIAEVVAVPKSKRANSAKPALFLGRFPLDHQRVIDIELEIVELRGVFDLPMVQSGRWAVEREYQRLTNGPEITPKGSSNVFVQEDKTTFYYVMESARPASLPVGTAFVVRTKVLREFFERLQLIEGVREGKVNARAETSYSNIIGALLELMLGSTPSGKKQSVFKDQAAIIEALIITHGDKYGLSKRNLEDKFAAAKLSLDAS